MFRSRIFLQLAALSLCLLGQISSLQASISDNDSSRLYLQTTRGETTMVSYQASDYMIIRYRGVGESRLQTFKGYLREVSGDSIRINHKWFSIATIEQASLPNANGKPVTRNQVHGRSFAGAGIALGLQVPAVGIASAITRGIGMRNLFEWTLEEHLIRMTVIFTTTYTALASTAIWPLTALTRTKKLGKRRMLVIE